MPNNTSVEAGAKAFRIKMAQIDADLRAVRLKKKALEAEDKAAKEIKGGGPLKNSKSKRFKSGEKAELYHPNLDYALAEVAYSPYLLGHLPKYAPDSKTAMLMNKMRFMGPKKCEEAVTKNQVTLPCDVAAARDFVVDQVMTYNPDFGPGENEGKKGAKSSSSRSLRPQSSMATVSTLLGEGETNRPRSPEYECAIARGGPTRYKKLLKEGSLATLGSTDVGFQSLFASQDSLPPGKNGGVPERAQGYYPDKYKFSDREWPAELKRRQDAEASGAQAKADAEYEREMEEEEKKSSEEKKLKREKKAAKKAAVREVEEKAAARVAYKEMLAKGRLELDERQRQEEAAKVAAERRREKLREIERLRAREAAGLGPSKFQVESNLKKARVPKPAAAAAEAKTKEQDEKEATHESKDEGSMKSAENCSTEETLVAGDDYLYEDDFTDEPAAPQPSAPAPPASSSAKAEVGVSTVTLCGVGAATWYGEPQEPFFKLSCGDWSARVDSESSAVGDDVVWEALTVTVSVADMTEGSLLTVQVCDDNPYEGEVALASATVPLSGLVGRAGQSTVLSAELSAADESACGAAARIEVTAIFTEAERVAADAESTDPDPVSTSDAADGSDSAVATLDTTDEEPVDPGPATEEDVVDEVDAVDEEDGM